MSEFLVALADFDAKKLWAELGYNGLFNFLRHELRLSKGASYTRAKAAELFRQFPAALEPIGDGRVCLSIIPIIAKVLTDENWPKTLPRFYWKSKNEALLIAASINPVKATPTRDVVMPPVTRTLSGTRPPAPRTNPATSSGAPVSPTYLLTRPEAVSSTCTALGAFPS
jgi:hypothetical protein